MPTALSYKGKLPRLRRAFLGISVLAHFHKRVVAAGCLAVVAAAVLVALHELGNDRVPGVGSMARQSDGAPTDPWNPDGVLALIDLFARPLEGDPATAPLYSENDLAAIQAAVELASARAYVTIMDLPEEGLRKYSEIVERFPGTEAAETARRELAMIGRKES